jgi:hypothetical protein
VRDGQRWLARASLVRFIIGLLNDENRNRLNNGAINTSIYRVAIVLPLNGFSIWAQICEEPAVGAGSRYNGVIFLN